MSWMGRYRPLIEAIVLHGHLSTRMAFKPLQFGENTELTAIEWQVLEYLYEHGEEVKMANVYNRLGIPQSTFSRAASTLCELGFAEKTFTESNKKNRIVQITASGRTLYEERASLFKGSMWEKFFEKLDPISDEDLSRVIEAISIINDDMRAV